MSERERSINFHPETGRIQSECGLFGVYLIDPTSRDVRAVSLQAGADLQHRAEGSAGMWISNGESSAVVRELGTVAVAFQEGRNLPSLESPNIAILHTRFPTAGGSNHKPNIQPLSLGGITLGHHGSLSNAQEIADQIGSFPRGENFPDSDSWIALNAIVREPGSTLAKKVINAQKRFEGGWAFIVSDGKTIVASRDPHGIRPLSVAVLGKEAYPAGYLLSVETCVFKNLGAYDFREVLPGETITIDKSGVKTVDISQKSQKSCIFEFVYMMRPDSEFLGKKVYETRREAGRQLWREAPVELAEGENLMVMPVPNSGRPSAIGYFHEAQNDLGLRVTYDEGLLSNAYFGRNFIKSTGQRRADLKFYAIMELLKDKIVALVDDSHVRGDTTGALVEILRLAGVRKTHNRIASPPVHHACPFGVEMGSNEKLLANRIPDIGEREKYLGASSLRYLSLAGLIKATGVDGDKFCTHCFNGKGPVLNGRGAVPLRE